MDEHLENMKELVNQTNSELSAIEKMLNDAREKKIEHFVVHEFARYLKTGSSVLEAVAAARNDWDI